MGDEAGGAADFHDRLLAAAVEEARRNGTTPAVEVDNHVYTRLMARVFAAEPDDWMVDGGRAMTIRFPGTRSTSDLDMSSTSGSGARQAVAEFIRASAADLGDRLEFAVRAVQEFTRPPGAQIDFAVTAGGRRMDDISVDVVMATPLAAEPESRPLPPPLVAAGTSPEPAVRIRPAVNQLADKIAGMYTWEDGLRPTRAKDLVDVLILASGVEFDGRFLRAAMDAEFDRRRARGDDLRLPARFEVPDPAWDRRYATAVARAPGAPERTLDEALPRAHAFLDPLLSPEPPVGRWNPRRWEWAGEQAQERGGREAAAERSAGTAMVALDNPLPSRPQPHTRGPDQGAEPAAAPSPARPAPGLPAHLPGRSAPAR